MGGIVDLERAKQQHAEESSRGLHDKYCEFGPRLFVGRGEPRQGFSTFCYCARRRRALEPVPDMSIWPTHSCPLCWKQPEEDECGYTCFHCEIAWDIEGKNGRLTDHPIYLGETVEEITIPSKVL